jgi:hypothetical protein
MKRQLILLAVTSFIYYSATAQTAKPKIDLIKTIRTVNSDKDSSFREFRYDALGRCIEVICKGGYFPFVATYNYNVKDTVVRVVKDVTSSSTEKTKFIIDSKGQATGMIDMYEYTEYICTPQGFLVQVDDEMEVPAEQYFTIENGNKVKEGNNTIYTYYPNKNTIGNKNIGINYLGKDNTNLVKNEITINDDGIQKILFTYLYQFDDKGRVTKRTRTDDEGYLTIDKYTYY